MLNTSGHIYHIHEQLPQQVPRRETARFQNGTRVPIGIDCGTWVMFGLVKYTLGIDLVTK
jgi:hypothetical protein